MNQFPLINSCSSSVFKLNRKIVTFVFLYHFAVVNDFHRNNTIFFVGMPRLCYLFINVIGTGTKMAPFCKSILVYWLTLNI